MKTCIEIIDYSRKHNLAHIPSALSQYSYLKYILPELKNFKIVIGKPFGAQAYYCIWEEMYNLPEKLGYGVKHEELDFVDFSEETLGNALGVASGVEIGSKQKVYCNISDGAFQMGPTQEAIQFIGKHKQQIFLTIDCNEFQLTGKTTDILDIDAEKIQKHFELYGWNTKIIGTSNPFSLNINNLKLPFVYIFKTKKGQGIDYMEKDPQKWHYKKLEN